ncbi:MAG: hypothetical protein JXB88_16210, partial [Spirochaetales bacterium]|nr:hypothetical protein [Spirochaetales bacterium]
MKRKKILINTLMRYIIFLFILLLSLHVFSQTGSQIPGGTDNYLQISNQYTAGILDSYCVVFYEIPDSITSTLYFGIYDPDIYYINPPDPAPYPPTDDDSSVAHNAWKGTVVGASTTFSLVGSTGTLSNAASKYVDYDSPSGPDDPFGSGMGTILDQFVNTNTTSNDGWVYFTGVNPSQGELIGNKRYFKIITYATATSGWIKNGFKMDISLNNTGNPTGVSGVKSFAYSWPVYLKDSNTWDIYPFVPNSAEGNTIRFYNWDIDNGEDLTSYDKDEVPDPLSTTIPLSGDTSTKWGDSEYEEYTINAGETNGTWRLRITENNSDNVADSVNTAEFWFANGTSVGSDFKNGVFRAYSSSYDDPPVADDVSISYEDGVAISDNNDTEKIHIQVVDSTGSPVPYSENIWFACDGTAIIDDASEFYPGYSAGGNSALVVSDGEGYVWVTIRDNTEQTVTITVVVNGNTVPGTDGNESNLSTTIHYLQVDFLTDIPPVMSSSGNLSFTEGNAQTLKTITITDSVTANITAANDIRIAIPGTLNAVFNTGATVTATVSGAAVGRISGNVSYIGTLTYESGNTVAVLDVTTDFDVDDILTISGLAFTSANSTSSGKLQLSYDGGTTYDVTDDKVITINDSNPSYVWDGSDSTNWSLGANWVGGTAPANDTDNVIIPYVTGFMPVLGVANEVVNNLFIENGATLTVTGTNFTINDTLSDNGTLDMGVNDLTVTSSVTGTGSLDCSGGGSVTIGGDITISTYVATGGTTTVGGDWDITSFTHNNGEVVFNGTGTTIISGNTTFYDLTCTTNDKTIRFEAGSTQTVSNTFTMQGSGGAEIVLESTSTGSQWFINVAAFSVSYVAVRDSNASSLIDAPDSINNGNNDNWAFTDGPTISSVVADDPDNLDAIY